MPIRQRIGILSIGFSYSTRLGDSPVRGSLAPHGAVCYARLIIHFTTPALNKKPKDITQRLQLSPLSLRYTPKFQTILGKRKSFYIIVFNFKHNNFFGLIYYTLHFIPVRFVCNNWSRFVITFPAIQTFASMFFRISRTFIDQAILQ